jgi:predicted nucleic acid-binding protein
MDSIVSNSSPLIGLDQLGILSWLEQLFSTIRIPPEVVVETTRTVVLPSWVQVVVPGTPMPAEIARAGLGLGETATLHLASELPSSLVVIDDLPARRLARRLGLRFTGTLGILVEGKRRGLITEIRPLVEQLRQFNFRVSNALVDDVLKIAGEL